MTGTSGLGAIPVEDARALLGDSLLTVIVTKGVDVTTVAHHGRTIPTAIRQYRLLPPPAPDEPERGPP